MKQEWTDEQRRAARPRIVTACASASAALNKGDHELFWMLVGLVAGGIEKLQEPLLAIVARELMDITKSQIPEPAVRGWAVRVLGEVADYLQGGTAVITGSLIDGRLAVEANESDFEWLFDVAKSHRLTPGNCREIALIENGKPLNRFTRGEVIGFARRICIGGM